MKRLANKSSSGEDAPSPRPTRLNSSRSSPPTGERVPDVSAETRSVLWSAVAQHRFSRADADGARNSFRRNVDLPIGFRGFRWGVLKHEMVLCPDDMGKRVTAGGKRTLLRNEFRAPAAPIAWFRFRLGRVSDLVRSVWRFQNIGFIPPHFHPTVSKAASSRRTPHVRLAALFLSID